MRIFKILLIILSLYFPAETFSRSLFVKETGAGDFTGKDWQNAIKGIDLVRVLEKALPLDTFNIAQGNYNPFFATLQSDGSTLKYNKDCTFFISSGISLFGGFSNLSTGTSLLNRDINQYMTFLSGDIGCSQNSVHVVTFSGTSGGLIDGIVILNGVASGTGEDGKGGGIYVADSTFNVSIVGCQIRGNYAVTGGAGINISKSARVNIESTTIFENTCTSTSSLFAGGGILLSGSTTSETKLQLVNTTIAYNNAPESLGGGICVYKPLNTKANFSAYFSTITSNTAKKAGGIYTDSTIVLDNVLLAGNSGYELYCKSASNNDAVKFITCINSIIGNLRYTNNTTIDLTAMFPSTVIEYLNYNTWKLLPNTSPTLALIDGATNPAINAGNIEHLNTIQMQGVYTKCKTAQNNINRLIRPAIGSYQPMPLTTLQKGYESPVICYESNNIIHIIAPESNFSVELYNALGKNIGLFSIKNNHAEIPFPHDSNFIIIRIRNKNGVFIKKLLN